MPTLTNELDEIRKQFIIEVDEFEVEFKRLHREQQRLAKRRGASDRRKSFEELTSGGFTPFEKSIFHTYQSQHAEMALDLESYLTKVNKCIVTTENQLKLLTPQEIEDDIKEVDQEKQKKLKILEKAYHDDLINIEDDITLDLLEQQFDDAEDAFESICDHLGRPHTNRLWKFNSIWYYVLIIFLGFAELGAAYGAFLHFEEPPVTTLLWALGFGICISVIGHFNGLSLAKGRDKKLFLFVGIGLFVAMIIVLIEVSLFRSKMSLGASDLLSVGVFIVISLALYVGVVAIAFFGHDSDPNFIRLQKALDGTRLKLDAYKQVLSAKKLDLKQDFETKVHAINQAANQEIETIQNQSASLQFLLRESMALYDEILVSLKNLELMINSYFHEVFGNYRSEANFDHDKLLNLNLKFNDLPEKTKDKNQGLWYYNPN